MKNVFNVLVLILLIFFIYSCKKDKPTPPIVSTTVVTDVSYTTATSGGEITNEGGASIISRGVCWNTSVDPTVSNNKTSESGRLGSFTSSITQLTPNTNYYVRAYATNSAGTAYGNHVTFTTNQVATATLTTSAITSITKTTAVSGGNIINDNGGSVTARGVCWSIDQNPTTANDKSVDGIGIGPYTSTITGLTVSTTYYLRAYATNNAGTSYGNEISFKTIVLPSLTTSPASTIGATFAVSGGNILDDGGAIVLERGVCWSTTANPTILDSKTTDGTGTGTFTSLISGLTAFRNYYVRAYATNNIGTTYGVQVSFTTTVADNIALTIPTGLALTETDVSPTANGSAYVILTWEAIINPILDHYKIEYKRSTYVYYTTIDATTNVLRIEPLLPNISYDFKIASVTKYGITSDFSTSITTVTAAETQPPATVNGISATAAIRGVLVEWTHNTEVDLVSYNIYRNTSNDSGSATLVANYKGNMYMDNGLTSSTTYYYWLKAIDTSGNLSANFSEVVSATTL